MALPLPAPGSTSRDRPVWEHLGGTSANVPCVRAPNLRTLATMWAVPEQRRLYMLGGNANRAAAHKVANQLLEEKNEALATGKAARDVMSILSMFLRVHQTSRTTHRSASASPVELARDWSVPPDPPRNRCTDEVRSPSLE